MQLQSITLNNFRQFKNQVIEFSQDKEKNITIILGKNTYGKTTLIKSFLWCLYKDKNLFNDKSLLNDDVAVYMNPRTTETVQVQLKLIHNNFSYVITTKQNYTKLGDGIKFVVDDPFTTIVKINNSTGESITINPSQTDIEINSILRSDLREFFFFDGENNTIEKISAKRNLKNAVSDIMGLKNIENLIDYYNPSSKESVTQRFQNKLELDSSSELEDFQGELEREREKLDNQKNYLLEYKSELDTLNGQISENEMILDENKEISDLQDERKKLMKEIDQFKNNIDNDFYNVVKQLNAGDTLVKFCFTKCFKDFKISEILHNSTFKSENSLKYIQEKAVDELIKRGYCLCGAKIETNSDAYNHLMAEKEHMEPNDYGKYCSDFISSEDSTVYYSQSNIKQIQDSIGKFLTNIEKNDKSKNRLNEINKAIAGKKDMAEIQKDLGKLREQRGTVSQKIFYNENTIIPSLEKTIENLTSKIKSCTIKNDKNDFYKTCINYCEHIYKLAINKLKDSEKKLRIDLEKRVSNIFNSMYSGNRIIKIDESFYATTAVKTAGGDKALDKSTGLETVKNFSFVAGLLNMVKDKLNTKEDDDELADDEEQIEVYPLVIDAPFSNTDEIHIRNICINLPKYSDQIIMFVMEKDFNYAKESIMDRIGKLYTIKKISETESELKENL